MLLVLSRGTNYEMTAADKYRMACWTAVVAGVLALVVCALLVYDYSRRLVKDPLDSAAFANLKDALIRHPADKALKDQVRNLDLQLRREYFRQRAFTATGAVLLTISALIFIFAAKSAVTLHRRLPQPGTLPSLENFEARWTRTARWMVAAMAGILIGVSVGLSFLITAKLPPKKVEILPSEEEFAKSWPRFRGPDGRGVSAYQNIPIEWDVPAGKNLRWKTPVPLPGNNSPVVWKDRIFLSGADKNHCEVYCFDAVNGKLRWTQQVSGTFQKPKVMQDTGYAAPTVATDGLRVYAIFANGNLACFDFDGNPVWSKSLGIPENKCGHAQSLLTYKNLLIIPFDQGTEIEPKSKLYAFDSASGDITWQIDRPVSDSWMTPITLRVGARDLVVTIASPWIIAYDLLKGSEVWRVKYVPPDAGASPTSAGGKVYAASTYVSLLAIRADGHGDIGETHIDWRGEDGLPEACSVLADEKFVFLQDAAGTLTCYDAQKGGVLWTEDFEEHGYSSPSLVGNKVYVIAESGKCWVVEPSPKACKRISENNLGEPCITSPAFQDGCFYVRGSKNLICIGNKK
jgi:outer membrane protein assembly factor BamB